MNEPYNKINGMPNMFAYSTHFPTKDDGRGTGFLVGGALAAVGSGAFYGMGDVMGDKITERATSYLNSPMEVNRNMSQEEIQKKINTKNKIGSTAFDAGKGIKNLHTKFRGAGTAGTIGTIGAAIIGGGLIGSLFDSPNS